MSETLAVQEPVAGCPDIEAECRAHFNEPILMLDRLARLEGYGEDDDDCYLIVRYLGGKRVWHTAVGGYVFLDCLRGRGVAGEYDDYKRVDNALTLNAAPPVPEFVREIITIANPRRPMKAQRDK